jgi:hypothetical protein
LVQNLMWYRYDINTGTLRGPFFCA